MNPNNPIIIQAGNQQIDLTAAADKVGGHVSHLLVESLANPGIVANSIEGRDNYTVEGTSAAKRVFHNYADERQAERAIGEMNYPSEDEVREANAKLGNTIIICPGGQGGRW